MNGIGHISILPIIAIHGNITHAILSQRTKFKRTTMEIHL